MKVVHPIKLDDGTWGVRAEEACEYNEIVLIVTRNMQTNHVWFGKLVTWHGNNDWSYDKLNYGIPKKKVHPLEGEQINLF